MTVRFCFRGYSQKQIKYIACTLYRYPCGFVRKHRDIFVWGKAPFGKKKTYIL